eukprot:COSAG01_NODE_5152_length_4451_cov_13.224724_8_plen_87_part_00
MALRAIATVRSTRRRKAEGGGCCWLHGCCCMALSEEGGGGGHMHPLHYWPGTQKFLNPRTGRAPLSRVLIGCTNGLLRLRLEISRS